jgi:acetyltransferase-like isoleucine patch superfamily enzyme
MEHLYYAPWQWKSIGKDVRIYEHCTILKPESIALGDSVRVDANVRLEGGISLIIGNYTHVASFCSLNQGGGELEIHAHCALSCGVRIATGLPDLSFLEVSPCEPPDKVHTVRKKTIIGEYCVLFSGSIILPGCTIGKGAVVGAGSVITKDVPSFEIWAGNPARKIRDREVMIR